MEYVLLNKDTPLLQFCIERHEDVVNLTTLVRMDISDLTIIDNANITNKYATYHKRTKKLVITTQDSK